MPQTDIENTILLDRTADKGRDQGGIFMGTKTRPELSERNQYWIPKHRYYELKHFCLQYPEWKERLRDLDGASGQAPGTTEYIDIGRPGDPTAQCADERVLISVKMRIVEEAAYEACMHQFWYTFLLKAITENLSYDILEARYGIMPISRNEWYVLYRKLFFLLDKSRG